jgi:hypothetical protein
MRQHVQQSAKHFGGHYMNVIFEELQALARALFKFSLNRALSLRIALQFRDETS